MVSAARTRLLLLVLLGTAFGTAPLLAADPGSWSQQAPLPGPRNEAASVVIDGKIHVVGGSAQGDYQLTKHELYDPATDRWRALATLPRGMNHVAATVVDGKIHIVGGRGLDDKTVATHEAFDPAIGKWTSLAPLPAPRDHVSLIAAGGKLHAIGGRTATPDTNIALHDVWDPATDKWQAAAPLLMPVSNAAATVYRGMILLAGGEGPGQGADGAFTQAQGYDLAAGTWQKLAPLPVGKHGWTGVTIGDKAYFPGGSNTNGSNGATAELMVFSLP